MSRRSGRGGAVVTTEIRSEGLVNAGGSLRLLASCRCPEAESGGRDAISGMSVNEVAVGGRGRTGGRVCSRLRSGGGGVGGGAVWQYRDVVDFGGDDDVHVRGGWAGHVHGAGGGGVVERDRRRRGRRQRGLRPRREIGRARL